MQQTLRKTRGLTEEDLNGITETEVAYRLGVAAQPVFVPGEGEAHPLAIVPEGFAITDLEPFLDRPLHTRGEATFEDVASFAAYVNAFQTTPRLFAQQDEKKVVGILDYHAPGSPSWNLHRAVLKLQYSPEWAAWFGHSGRAFKQVEFAEWLEDRHIDIVEPDGATVLEAAAHLEAKKTVNFKSGVSLDSGAASLVYEETINGTGKGNIKIPTRLKLCIPIYRGGKAQIVSVRLRYRIADDKLTFTFLIDRKEQVIDLAFGAVLEEIEAATEFKPLLGSVT